MRTRESPGPAEKAGKGTAALLDRSILLSEHEGPPLLRGALLFGALATAAFFAWSAFARLEEMEVATGELVPAEEPVRVQHPISGQVTEVLVREGSRVEAGQPILRMDVADSTMQRAQLQTQLYALKAQRERLAAAAQGRKPDFSALPGIAAQFVADQRALYEAGEAQSAIEVAISKGQVEQARVELERVIAKKAALAKQIVLAEEEAGVASSLADEAFASKSDLLSKQRSLEALRQEERTYASEEARIRVEMESLAGRRSSLARQIALAQDEAGIAGSLAKEAIAPKSEHLASLRSLETLKREESANLARESEIKLELERLAARRAGAAKQIALAEEETGIAVSLAEKALGLKTDLISKLRSLESLRQEAESFAAQEEKASVDMEEAARKRAAIAKQIALAEEESGITSALVDKAFAPRAELLSKLRSLEALKEQEESYASEEERTRIDKEQLSQKRAAVSKQISLAEEDVEIASSLAQAAFGPKADLLAKLRSLESLKEQENSFAADEKKLRMELATLEQSKAAISTQIALARSESDLAGSAAESAYGQKADLLLKLRSLESLKEQAEVLGSDEKKAQIELERTAQKRTAAARQITIAEQESALADALMASGLSLKEGILVKLRALASLKDEEASYAAEEQKARERKAEAESRLSEYYAARSKTAREELASVNERIAQAESGILLLENASNRLEATAPIAGIIHSLSYRTAGTVVTSGSTIAEIIPVGKPPKAQIRIDPKSIGSVFPGLGARLKISAYPSDRFGAFRGTLSEVSPTTFVGNDGKPYYRGIIDIAGRELEDSATLDLVPGMTLTAELRTGSKSLLNYLLKPIFSSARESFREK